MVTVAQFKLFSIIYIFTYELIIRFFGKVWPVMRKNVDDEEFAHIFSSKRLFVFFYVFVFSAAFLSTLPIIGFLYLAEWSPVSALLACALFLVYKFIAADKEGLTLKPGYIVDYVMVNIPLFILCYEMIKN